MNIEQLRAVANEKTAQAQKILDSDDLDMDAVKGLLKEAEDYLARADLLVDAQTLIKKANPRAEEEKPQPSGIQVVADEEDKKKAVKTWSMGDFYQAVALAPDTVRAYRSSELPGHYNVSEAVGVKAIGNLHQAKLKARKAITGLSESVPADGGFLVQTDWGGSLMDRVYDTSMLARMVDTTPISANSNGMSFYANAETSRADGSRRGGARYYWLEEGGDKTISHQTYRKVELQLNKIIVRIPATDELLQDTTALESEIFSISSEEIGFGIDDSILNGTGGGMPQGVIGSGATVAVPAETGQAAATIVSQNIINMWARRWVRYRDYVWIINQDVTPQLLQMNLGVGTGGALTFMPPGGLSGLPYGTLFGRPVIEHESAQTLGTQGDIILWSPSSYKAIEKGGIQTASSIHVRWVNDETEYRSVFRYDGEPKWNQPLTPYNSTATQSPQLILATRS